MEQNIHTKRKKQGNLTIYLGAVAGVGKTYAMLEVGNDRKNQGIDVVIGWLENKEQPETKKLLKGIQIIPPQKRMINGNETTELDVKAIIRRQPSLVLIDGLAKKHSFNTLHKFRYQDVEDIMKAGIDVLTTLNIQQVESLNDVVAQITGVREWDTVPDSFLEKADQIKLIDIPPDELIQRLKEGKVNISEEKLDVKKFFRTGNIHALRELAFRYTAQRIEQQLNQYMKANDISGPWPTGEKIMACISPSPFSQHVIRTAGRMAAGLRSEWVAAYVETPRRSLNNQNESDNLARNIRLAESLGAEVISLTGEDVALELLSLAQRKNITHIVVGKPRHSVWKEIIHGSVVDKIIKDSKGIHVHAIPGEAVEKKNNIKTTTNIRTNSFTAYAGTMLFIVFITLLNKILAHDLINIALLYLLPVLFSAALWGRGPSIMASLLGVLTFDIFFVPPVLSITVDDLRYLLSFGVFLLVAVTTGTMAIRLRDQARFAREREMRTAALYSLSRKIVAETDICTLANTIVMVTSETIEGEAALFLPDKKNKMRMLSKSTLTDAFNEEQAKDAIEWVFQHGQAAGKGSDTYDNLEEMLIPLKTENKCVGVLGVKGVNKTEPISPEHKKILEAFANLAALAIIKLQLAEEANKAKLLGQSEKLRTALFNSISHELRTPLSSITGAVTTLLDDGVKYNDEDKRALMQTVHDGAVRMNRLVGNLLDMARLESGMLILKKEWCDIQEIIGVALRRLQDNLKERDLKIDIPVDLPLVRVDFTLIEQVIVNLIDNALKYSPAESEIGLKVYINEDMLYVSIADKGRGISEKDRIRIFDKFFRLYSLKSVSGTGLGLSICKGIIEAHEGEIWVEDNNGAGSVFSFSLPCKEKAPDGIDGMKVGVDFEQ